MRLDKTRAAAQAGPAASAISRERPLEIAASARGLRKGYSAGQVEAALGNCLGVDRQLIRDGTYFVAEVQSEMAGCGGWSKRKICLGDVRN